MTHLIKLANIPASARAREAEARRTFASRQIALDAAQYRIEMAPGCHCRPADDAPVVGWTVTRSAAIALSQRLTMMPGGATHCRLTYTRI